MVLDDFMEPVMTTNPLAPEELLTQYLATPRTHAGKQGCSAL